MSLTVTAPDPSFHANPLPYEITNNTLYATGMSDPAELDLLAEVLAENKCKPSGRFLDERYEYQPCASLPVLTLYKGRLEFQSTRQAEKALAIHICALFGYKVAPRLSPFSDKNPPFNYVRPRQLIPRAPEPGSAQTWPTPAAQIPNVGYLWDIIRPWGALSRIDVRALAVRTESDDFEDEYDSGEESDEEEDEELCTWKVQVSFCDEDEAQRFEDNVTYARGWEFDVQKNMKWFPPLAVVNGRFPEGAMEERKRAWYGDEATAAVEEGPLRARPRHR